MKFDFTCYVIHLRKLLNVNGFINVNKIYAEVLLQESHRIITLSKDGTVTSF